MNNDELKNMFYDEDELKKKEKEEFVEEEEMEDDDLPEEEEFTQEAIREWEENDRKEKGLLDWMNDNGGFDEFVAVENFNKLQGGNLAFFNHEFYEWNGIYWSRMSEIAVKSRIRRFLEHGAREQRIRVMYTHLSLVCFIEKGFNVDKNLINLENGVLDLRSFRLVAHQRDFYMNYYFPCKFNLHGEKAHRWLTFLDEIGLSEKTIMFLQEFFGYCFTYETCAHKCLFLHGDGANGKSRIIDTLAYLFGNGQPEVPVVTTSLEPGEVFKQFSTSMLEYKFLNFATDIDTKVTLGDPFKKIVDGSEIKAEKKNLPPYTFRPYTKHIFAGNNLPTTKDRSHGFYRRFWIIGLYKLFSGKDEDRHLQEKLNKEKHPIFNWAMIGLKRLIDNEWKFTESAEMKNEEDKFKISTNLVLNFITEYYPNSWEIEKGEFREHFYEWCRVNKYKEMSDRLIGREMGRLGFEPTRSSVKGKRMFFYRKKSDAIKE